jgi:hypothetical protein
MFSQDIIFIHDRYIKGNNLFKFVYKNKKGKKFWLHVKIGRGGTKLYYFSKDPRNAVNLPPGYVVVESARTGLPILRKRKK